MNKKVIEPVIREIVESIHPGYVFDAHFIIDRLLIDSRNAYTQFITSFGRNTNITTNSVHGFISQAIASFEGTLIKRLRYPSLSRNIRSKPSRCTIWIRI